MTHREYLAAHLTHEPGCEAFRNVPDGFFTHVRVSGNPCTCPVADILAAWDAREAALQEIEILIENSRGVCGLHANGDEATWEDLSPGGAYEDWLESLPRALADLEGE